MSAEQSTRVRAFFAARLPSVAYEELRNVQAELHRRSDHLRLPLRFCSPEQIHITLKFLGNTERDLIPELDRILSSLASQCAALVTNALRFDAFPSSRRANVLVLRLSDNEGRFRRLAQLLDECLETQGFVPETRPFVPHVTLARSRRPSDVRQLLPDVPLWNTTFEISELVLFESKLTRDGSIYTALATTTLLSSV